MYAKLEGGVIVKYPYHHRNLKEDNRNVSFPPFPLDNESIRSDYGVAEVISASPPVKPGWNAEEEDPSLNGSVWSQNWKLVAKDAHHVLDEEAEAVEKPVQEGYIAVKGIPELVDGIWKQTWNLEKQTWLENRINSYGAYEDQVEFITENGLEAWQAKVAEIKAKYPKS